MNHDAPESSAERPAGSGFPLTRHRCELRVRYQETDAQGRCHHANYLNFFEVARVEMLRAGGFNYRDLEASGVFLVVVEANCEYRGAAVYDDVLEIETTLTWTRGTRIRHDYRITKGGTEIVVGHTVVASVSPEGKVLRLPVWLRLPSES